MPWKIPLHLRGKVSINLLEFISIVVTIQLSLKNKGKNEKVITFTDNFSALGWLHKASFHPAEKSKHDQVARYFAKCMIQDEHSLYAEHIKGATNNVAESLSREFDFTNQQLTFLLYTIFNKQMPANFTIRNVPKESSSWIISILENAITGKEPKNSLHKKTNADWRKWQNFCDRTGIKSEFLESFTRQQKIEIICAFTAAIRRNNVGKTKKQILYGDTVKSTVRHVCQIFWINRFNNPGSDKTGATNIQLNRIFNGYKKSDPNTRNQCTLPLDVIKLLYFNRLLKKSKHIGLLATGALFFGMCSFEYLRVKNQEQKQTKLLPINTFFSSSNKMRK